MSTVSKVVAILETIAKAGSPGLSFSQIVEDTGIPKATAHRLLRDLVANSMLSFDTLSRHYRGGMTLARLGASVTVDYDLRTAVRPSLEALQRDTGHVTTLGVRNDDTGVYVDKIEPNDFRIRLHSEVGKTFPLHCTAMGKVLLAHAASADLRRITNRQLEAFTKHTITNRRALRAELKRVRDDGYALDREEITRALMCVAAPIYDVHGEVSGALSCTFPSYISDDRSIEPEIAAVVRHAKAASGLN